MNAVRPFHAAVFVLALSLSACGSAPPAPMAPTVDMMTPGAKVEVNSNGQWWPATVVQVVADKALVHYDGYGDDRNETVSSERIRPNAAAQPAKDYKPGEKVLVQVPNKVVLADVVMQVAPTTWRVHYDGFGAEAAENVGPERLKRPYAGPSPHAIGEDVGVEFPGTSPGAPGQVMAGKVIALAAQDKWIVRFPAFGPTFDAEIGADRIKPAPAAGPATPAPAHAPAAPPPAPVPPPVPEKKPEPAAAFQTGEAVFVHERARFIPASIVAQTPKGWKIHYEAVIPGDDEVATDRIMKAPARAQRFNPGQNVYVEWHGMYVTGRVLAPTEDGSAYRVRFDGQAPETDEFIPARRLRLK